MFSFASRNRRYLFGIGASLTAIGVYCQLRKSNDMKIISHGFCESKFDSKQNQYKKYLKEFKKKVKDLESSKWELYAEKDGCTIDRISVDGSDFYVIRGRTISTTKKSLKKIMNDLNDTTILESKRHIYERVDPDNVYFKVLKTFKKGVMYLCHARFTAHSWVVSDRDFILVRETKISKKKKEGICYGGSVDFLEGEDSEEYPKDEECVRGDLFFYWLVKKLDEGYSVKYVIHIDPKGSIPTFIYNMVCMNQTNGVLMTAREVMEEDDDV